MALTEALVALTRRAIEDAGPTPGFVPMSEEDYRRERERILAEAPAGPLLLFAYGSLLWKPGCEVVGGERAIAQGWHRAFCFRVQRFRGTVERPGLMMALDRGGQCQGLVYEIAAPIEASLDALLRREMTVLPAVNRPRWLTVRTLERPLRALGFVVDPKNPRYVGRLSLDEAADVIAGAAGHWGSCAEYLFETVASLASLGIRDRNLWRLQARVAEILAAQVAGHS
jgi:cation transport protein ChaC